MSKETALRNFLNEKGVLVSTEPWSEGGVDADSVLIQRKGSDCVITTLIDRKDLGLNLNEGVTLPVIFKSLQLTEPDTTIKGVMSDYGCSDMRSALQIYKSLYQEFYAIEALFGKDLEELRYIVNS